MLDDGFGGRQVVSGIAAWYKPEDLIGKKVVISTDTQKEIDEKVVQLVKAEHEKARKILSENREKLDDLAMYLYEKETITGDEFMDILDRK